MRQLSPLIVLAGAAILTSALLYESDRAQAAEDQGQPAGDKTAREGPRRLALLVGISKYERSKPRKTPPDWWDLNCENDIIALKKVLMERFRFREHDIRVLINSAATREGIVKAFETHLIKNAEPGAVVYFHYSGHGQRVADDNDDEEDGLDESLVTANYKSQSAKDGAETNLRDDTLGELLQQLRTRMVDPADKKFKGNIAVTMDCCFSGTNTRGEPPRENGRLRDRGRDWIDRIDGPRPKKSTRGQSDDAGGLLDRGEATSQGYVVLTATRNNQTAKEKEDEHMNPMGAFTFYLARELDDPANKTFRALFERVNAEMAADLTIHDQNPTLEGTADTELFSGTAVPRDPYVVVQGVEGDVIVLPVGQVHGTTAGSRFALYRAGSDVKEPKNRIGEAEVVEVKTTTCTAKLLGDEASRPKKEDLLAARAVEVQHNYGNEVLRILLDPGVPGPVAEEIGKLRVLDTKGVTETTYDVRVTPNPAGNRPVLLSKAGRKRGVDARAPYAAKQVRDFLFREWKRQFFTNRLKNDDPSSLIKVDIRLVPVTIKLDPNGKLIPGSVQVREDVKAEGNRLALKDGDYVMLEVRNLSERIPAYIYVLNLTPKGAIKAAYPDPREIPEFAGDGQWHPLKRYLFRLKKETENPTENDTYKAIATMDPTDLSGLLLEEENQRGGENVRGMVTKMRGGRGHGLGRLIGLVKLGEDPDPSQQQPLQSTGLRGEPISVETTDWGATDFVVEIR